LEYCNDIEVTRYKEYRVNAMYPYFFGILPLPNSSPVVRMVPVLTTINRKPVTTDGDKETAASAFPVLPARLLKPKPRPTRILKSGPAKQAVMATVAG
jgi:hypothetical protein